MTTRVVGAIVSFAVGIGAVWVAFTGKSVYSGLTSGSRREPMPLKEGPQRSAGNEHRELVSKDRVRHSQRHEQPFAREFNQRWVCSLHR
jgi:hypothetical protein